ncbi:MAG: hypothetical protein IAE77_00060 [Prosthecobacter sp.]|uniref:hypothetical protein n=1 Tax=Prosthecobacter sp. TaxID=1965333 RepID=UPI0019F021E4|nr:hypothetical protein [Prosthecobacter sp.]MBE2281832.1 hypothetical protein [Prosthecobacter sp.]
MKGIKNHVKKAHRGIQIDLYQSPTCLWFACIPDRVNFVYKSPEMKTKDQVIADCKRYIDAHYESLCKK